MCLRNRTELKVAAELLGHLRQLQLLCRDAGGGTEPLNAGDDRADGRFRLLPRHLHDARELLHGIDRDRARCRCRHHADVFERFGRQDGERRSLDARDRRAARQADRDHCSVACAHEHAVGDLRGLIGRRRGERAVAHDLAESARERRPELLVRVARRR